MIDRIVRKEIERLGLGESPNLIFASMDDVVRVELMKHLGVFRNADIRKRARVCCEYIKSIQEGVTYTDKKFVLIDILSRESVNIRIDGDRINMVDVEYSVRDMDILKDVLRKLEIPFYVEDKKL